MGDPWFEGSQRGISIGERPDSCSDEIAAGEEPFELASKGYGGDNINVESGTEIDVDEKGHGHVECEWFDLLSCDALVGHNIARNRRVELTNRMPDAGQNVDDYLGRDHAHHADISCLQLKIVRARSCLYASTDGAQISDGESAKGDHDCRWEKTNDDKLIDTPHQRVGADWAARTRVDTLPDGHMNGHHWPHTGERDDGATGKAGWAPCTDAGFHVAHGESVHARENHQPAGRVEHDVSDVRFGLAEEIREGGRILMIEWVQRGRQS